MFLYFILKSKGPFTPNESGGESEKDNNQRQFWPSLLLLPRCERVLNLNAKMTDGVNLPYNVPVLQVGFVAMRLSSILLNLTVVESKKRIKPINKLCNCTC